MILTSLGPGQRMGAPLPITSVVTSFKDLMNRKKHPPPIIEVCETKV
jgi:hypothetical protein